MFAIFFHFNFQPDGYLIYAIFAGQKKNIRKLSSCKMDLNTFISV